MPTTINPKLVSWASHIEPGTIVQAEKTARLPIVDGHVALMPDAPVDTGATVGSVIPTQGAVIPSAVGVDIGCGMIAAELDVTEDQLPDSPRDQRVSMVDASNDTVYELVLGVAARASKTWRRSPPSSGG